MKAFLTIAIIFCAAQIFFGQVNCNGTTLFTEKKCAGDEITPVEKELFRLINEYRAQNNLPPVALSESLSYVANRHIIDLTQNVKYLTHSWSNCPYDIKSEKTWDCVFESPQRLNAGFQGQGFENLYRNLNGKATPALALEAWKKSPMHNNLILNLDVWKSTKYAGLGLAVSGDYAAIWFGSKGDQEIDLGKEVKGLGISFGKLVKGLTTVLSIETESSTGDSEKWVGKSSDNSIKLEIYGQEKDIAETTMSFSVRLDNKYQIAPQGRVALSQFVKNLADNWVQREKWIDTALLNLSKKPKAAQTIAVENKTFQLKIGADNYLMVIVKPNPKPAAVEL